MLGLPACGFDLGQGLTRAAAPLPVYLSNAVCCQYYINTQLHVQQAVQGMCLIWLMR